MSGFVGLERTIIELDSRMTALDGRVMSAIGALKESIEARDFRLDEQGRRLNRLEQSQP
jgi:hypothetical protein